MAHSFDTAPRPTLSGRRGWAVVTTLTLALGALVGGQLAGQDASASALQSTSTAAPPRR
jgi:hypothetical protein